MSRSRCTELGVRSGLLEALVGRLRRKVLVLLPHQIPPSRPESLGYPDVPGKLHASRVIRLLPFGCRSAMNKNCDDIQRKGSHDNRAGYLECGSIRTSSVSVVIVDLTQGARGRRTDPELAAFVNVDIALVGTTPHLFVLHSRTVSRVMFWALYCSGRIVDVFWHLLYMVRGLQRPKARCQ